MVMDPEKSMLLVGVLVVMVFACTTGKRRVMVDVVGAVAVLPVVSMRLVVAAVQKMINQWVCLLQEVE